MKYLNILSVMDKFDIITVEETIANVHYDLFQLLKVDGELKIISKIFYQLYFDYLTKMKCH